MPARFFRPTYFNAAKAFSAALPIFALLSAGFATSASAMPFFHPRPAAINPSATTAAPRLPANSVPTNSGRATTPFSPPMQLPGQVVPNQQTGQGNGQAATPPPRPATAQERAAARTLDIVRQAEFWSSEVQVAPTDLEAALEASRSLRRLGSFDRSVEMAAIGLQSHGDSAPLWTAMGLAMVGNENGEGALAALGRAVQLDPSDVEAAIGLGIAYDLVDQAQLAISNYRHALTMSPDNVQALTNLGLSLGLSGQLVEAETQLRRAVSLPNAPVQARQNLALVLALAGKFDESQTIAAQDLGPEAAAENTAYLRELLANHAVNLSANNGQNGNGENMRWQAPRALNSGVAQETQNGRSNGTH